MKELTRKKTGWRPMPLSLKIIFVLLVFWIIGTIFNLSNIYRLGIPFFGLWTIGIIASFFAILLDIVGPTIFLFGLWTRKSWTPLIAYIYMPIFIINGVIAFFTFREQLGLLQILIPNIVELFFLMVVYSKSKYFL